MYCKTCGSKQDDNAYRCTKCGDFLHEASWPPQHSNLPARRPEGNYPAPPRDEEHLYPHEEFDQREPAPIANHLTLAIFSLLLFFPLGIPALVYATQVHSRLRVGDYAGAFSASSWAKTLGIAGVIIGGVGLLGMLAVGGAVI